MFGACLQITRQLRRFLNYLQTLIGEPDCSKLNSSGKGQLRGTRSTPAAPPATSTASNPRQLRPKDLSKTRRDIHLVKITNYPPPTTFVKITNYPRQDHPAKITPPRSPRQDHPVKITPSRSPRQPPPPVKITIAKITPPRSPTTLHTIAPGATCPHG